MPSNQMLAITTEDSNDDFEPPCKRAKLQVQDDKMDIPAYESAISALLPDDYLYTDFEVSAYDSYDRFQCTFRILIESEEAPRKWLQKYNENARRQWYTNEAKEGMGSV
jgi:hypothetical protein